MSFIDTPERYPYAWYLRPLLTLMRRRLGKLPESVRLWARLPLAFIGFQLMHRALEHRTSPLDGRLRALIRTQIAGLNSCRFCVDLNTSHALERGATDAHIDALTRFRESSLFTDGEKAAFTYAEAVTVDAGSVEPALIDSLRLAYGDEGVITLAALVAHQNLSAKFNAALGVPAEGYCQLRAPTVGTGSDDETPRG
jgi:AhpD family alkylhydroperoxidase